MPKPFCCRLIKGHAAWACYSTYGGEHAGGEGRSLLTQHRRQPMATFQKKSLITPDETRSLPKTTVEVVNFGEVSAMKTTFDPGWRWSEHVKPTAGSASCQVAHFGYVLSGR